MQRGESKNQLMSTTPIDSDQGAANRPVAIVNTIGITTVKP